MQFCEKSQESISFYISNFYLLKKLRDLEIQVYSNKEVGLNIRIQNKIMFEQSLENNSSMCKFGDI